MFEIISVIVNQFLNFAAYVFPASHVYILSKCAHLKKNVKNLCVIKVMVEQYQVVRVVFMKMKSLW